MTNQEIKEAVCVEIRSDGAQCFKSAHPDTPEHLRVLWLCGVDRVQCLKVGDTGTLVYQSALNRGFYRFIREDVA